jgi:hypothetical protein
MTILDHWEINLTDEDVLKAQGANPDTIIQRRPSLVENIREGMCIGSSLIDPKVLYEKYSVSRFVHQRLELKTNNSKNGKGYLSGELIAQHLAQSQEIIVMVCTIGDELDNMVSSLFKVNPVLAIALDGYGSAAVEKLSLLACNYCEKMAQKEGLFSTMPLNPGMIGWPLEVGQPEIFLLVDSEDINITLTESLMMMPNKSLSMVIGLGADKSVNTSSCDFCNLKGVCRYQDHYAKQS